MRRKIINVTVCFMAMLFLTGFAYTDEYGVPMIVEEPAPAEVYVEEIDYEHPIIIDVPEEKKEEEPELEGTFAPVRTIGSDIYEIPAYGGMKKYESYKAFGKGTKQWKLQQIAETDEHGLRVVSYRYVVAVGTRYDMKIGQCFDLVLQNGVIIPCVMGDAKAPKHTDPTNTFSNTTKNLCASEFIVDVSKLNKVAKHRGDTSFIYDEWLSPVSYVVCYDLNLLEEVKT